MGRQAVLVDIVRSPMAKGRKESPDRPGGGLSTMHPVDLLGQVIAQLVARNNLDPNSVEDVITGCVSQVGEQTGGLGRWAWLSAGLPEHVPSVSLNRACGSGQQAADFAAQGVIAGAYDIVIASGVESMSRIPMLSARMGQDPYGPLVGQRYAPGLIPQGVSAELVAAKWNVNRTEMDAYSAQSHQRAAAADLTPEIVPISLGDGRIVREDETIRPNTTADRLAELAPAFKTPEMSERYPELIWQITAGNSSQITDGAAAALIMSADRAEALGLRPRARFHSFAVVGDNPVLMLTGPIPASEKALGRAGLRLSDIDHIEVNEAFASVPLAWARHFNCDQKKLNPRGGAIALGHPLGASGLRLLATMLHGLEETGGRYGLQTMCEAGGMANATIIERL
jgi:acetyl-CoA acyltransferase